MLEDPAQPLIAVGWHIPNSVHPDWPAIEALADYLGQGRTSLLYKNLVKEKKLAAEAASFAGYPGSKYPCLFLAYAMPTPGHNNDECEEQILLEVERMKTELIPEEEVAKIKARAKADFINRLNNNTGLAMQLATFQNRWGDWREMFRTLERINAVTAEDIKRVANEYLNRTNSTVAMLNTIES